MVIRNPVYLAGVFALAIAAFPAAARAACGGTVDPSEQFRRQLYKAETGSCQPGTEVKYQTVARNLPYFELKYVEGSRVIPMACHPQGDACGCTPMLMDGESFSVADLQKFATPKEGDQNKFSERIVKVLHKIVKVGETAMHYGGVAIPLGDGVTAFLSDMGERLDDRSSEKDKEKKAAEDMRMIFGSLLSCKDQTHAPYKDGSAVEKALAGLFIDLSQDKKIDMGDNAGNDMGASFIKIIESSRKIYIEPTYSEIQGTLTDPSAVAGTSKKNTPANDGEPLRNPAALPGTVAGQ